MLFALIFICLVTGISAHYAEDIYELNPEDRLCLPTSVVHGPCHTCICSDDGAYHCKPKECSTELDLTHPSKGECTPHHWYRDGIFWCSCSALGLWKSSNCRHNFKFISDNPVTRNEVSIPNANCESKTLYAVDCNICLCLNEKLKNCTAKKCTGSKTDSCTFGQALRLEKEFCVCHNGHYEDKLCVSLSKNKIIKIGMEDLATLTRKGRNGNPLIHKCDVGATFYLDCNKCKCNKNGILRCTDKTCLTKPKLGRMDGNMSVKILNVPKVMRQNKDNVERIELKSLDDTCEPGKQYKYGCNLCFCTAKGLPSCTQMLCLDDFQKDTAVKESTVKKLKKNKLNLEEVPLPPEKCKPGRNYMARDGCNTCKCTNIQTLLCTKVACLNNQDYKTIKEMKKVKKENRQKPLKRPNDKKNENHLPKTKCEPGQVYKKGCQRCFCTDRKIGICTNKPCSEMKNPISSIYDIRPSISAKEAENPEYLPHESAKCEPGKTYKVDCNWCACASNGDTICSLLLCPSFEDVNRIAAKNHCDKPCTKSTEPADCVKCDCVKGKTECRRVDNCRPKQFRKWLHGDLNDNMVLKPDDDKCVPGMAYKQKCNRCYCQEDGSLRCTRKGCLTYQQVETLKKRRQKLLKEKGP